MSQEVGELPKTPETQKRERHSSKGVPLSLRPLGCSNALQLNSPYAGQAHLTMRHPSLSISSTSVGTTLPATSQQDRTRVPLLSALSAPHTARAQSMSITQNDRVRIDELRLEGMGGRTIAIQLGLTYGQVRYHSEKHNLNTPPPGPPPDKVRPIIAKTFDLETTNLNTFFGRLIVAAFLDMADESVVMRHLFHFKGTVEERERQLLEWTQAQYEDADILIGHNISAFDHNFLNGRMSQHDGMGYLEPRIHIDTLQVARHGFKGRTQGSSLENLLDFFRIAIQKDKPSKHDWAGSVLLDEASVLRIAERCVADVRGNALLWTPLRQYYHRWKGRH